MKKPKFFRTRPRTVRAMRLDYDLLEEENLQTLKDFVGNSITFSKSPQHVVVHDPLDISFQVNIGDWIIKNEKGQVSPCDNNLFDDMYEKV